MTSPVAASCIDKDTSNRIVGFQYTRDANGRIIEDVETRRISGTDNTATTTYTYGAGNLASGDLASDGPLTYGKLHYNWLSTPHTSAGDPNRLVKERRYGIDSAMGPFDTREYWPWTHHRGLRPPAAGGSSAARKVLCPGLVRSGRQPRGHARIDADRRDDRYRQCGHVL